MVLGSGRGRPAPGEPTGSSSGRVRPWIRFLKRLRLPTAHGRTPRRRKASAWSGGGTGEDIGGCGPLGSGLNAVARQRGEVGEQGLEACGREGRPGCAGGPPWRVRRARAGWPRPRWDRRRQRGAGRARGACATRRSRRACRGRRGRGQGTGGSPAIQTRFSRFCGTVQQSPVRRQGTQIVQP